MGGSPEGTVIHLGNDFGREQHAYGRLESTKVTESAEG